MSLAATLPAHDARVLAALVSHALKTRSEPNWRDAWTRLTDIGRHILLKAEPAAVFIAALECWAAAGGNMAARLVRKATLGNLHKKHEAEAVREINRQQCEIKSAGAMEAVA